jgi:anti-sigma regulatory factor (Ser/Thr protein kinase)/putative methionine-R-sulfoxide reductase with GAF domain
VTRRSDQIEAGPGPAEGHVLLGLGGHAPDNLAPEKLADLYRLGDPALSDLDLNALLAELLHRIRHTLSVDTVAILLIDERREFLEARAAVGIEEEVERGVRIPMGRGFAGRIAAERTAIYIADVSHAEILNPILREKGIKSLLGVPLIVEAELIGVLHVGTLQPREFTNDDASLLQLAAARVAPGIERARLFHALEREHRLALALQRSFLPAELPEVSGVTVAGRYFAARDEVGGDWYDVIDLHGGLIGIAIGDVVGHGARAAALMGQLRTAVRAYAVERMKPGAVLERVNRLLQAIRERGMATASYAIFDSGTAELSIATAGHPPPLIIPPSGAPHFLQVDPGPPLGVVRHPEFVETSITLPGEGMVLLYTDGLIEVRGESMEMGFDRLVAAAGGAPSADELCTQVTRALVLPGGMPDDVALVTLRNSQIRERVGMRFPAEPTALARVRQLVRRWIHQFDPTAEDVRTILLACGEACANAIEHAYSPQRAWFEVEFWADDDVVHLVVRDSGRWRPARGQHRGRGLAIMKTSMDEVEIRPGDAGTEVIMSRRLRA